MGRCLRTRFPLFLLQPGYAFASKRRCRCLCMTAEGYILFLCIIQRTNQCGCDGTLFCLSTDLDDDRIISLVKHSSLRQWLFLTSLLTVPFPQHLALPSPVDYHRARCSSVAERANRTGCERGTDRHRTPGATIGTDAMHRPQATSTCAAVFEIDRLLLRHSRGVFCARALWPSGPSVQERVVYIGALLLGSLASGGK